MALNQLQALLQISNKVTIPEYELQFEAIRAQGAGGQHVNKQSTAIHLSFDVNGSSLPTTYKERILAFQDHRISLKGVIVIKAQQYRSQWMNRVDAVERLIELIKAAMVVQRKRIATGPSRAAKRKRTDSKVKRGQLKATRKNSNFSNGQY